MFYDIREFESHSFRHFSRKARSLSVSGLFCQFGRCRHNGNRVCNLLRVIGAYPRTLYLKRYDSDHSHFLKSRK